MRTSKLIFVDCEARGTSPVRGTMTEFGAVHYDCRDTFHGVLYRGRPDPLNPAIPIVMEPVASPVAVAEAFRDWLVSHVTGRSVFISDNVAYDWQWISALFDVAGIVNPFGHSGRRISDFYAGLTGDWHNTQEWKRWRETPHDHNPVNDAMGNVEAFATMLRQYLALPPNVGRDEARAAASWTRIWASSNRRRTRLDEVEESEVTYATLAELQDAYLTGALSRDARNPDPLVIDNDVASVVTGDELDAEEVFEMHPADLLEQALDLLGIPWERI